MKPCLIVPSLEVRHGGPSKSVLGLARALANGGERVELLTTEPGNGSERVEGALHISSFHRSWPTSICASAGLRGYLQKVDAGVVHHHSIWLRTLHYARDAASRLKAPLVVSPPRDDGFLGMEAPQAQKGIR